MAKQSPVQAAYGKGNKSGNGAGWGRCASLGLFIVLGFFLMKLSGDTNDIDEGLTIDEVRTGQAKRPTEVDKVPNHVVGYNPSSNRGSDSTVGSIYDKNDNDDFNGNDDNVDDDNMDDGSSVPGSSSSSYSSPGLRGSTGDTEKDMSDLVDVATMDIARAGQDEVGKEESMLMSTLSSMGSSIRSGLASLFGNSADAQEVEAIAVAVEEELKKNVTEELEVDAEAIEEEEIMDIDVNAAMEDEEGVEIEEIEKDVMVHEGQAIKSVRNRIDNRAEAIQNKMKLRAAMIEKEMMEKRLSAKLGYPVKLQIVGDQVKGFPPPQTYNPNGAGGYQGYPPQQQPQQQPYYQPQPGQYRPPQNQQQQQQPYRPPQNQQGDSSGGVPYQQPGQYQYQPQNNNFSPYRPPQQPAGNGN